MHIAKAYKLISLSIALATLFISCSMQSQTLQTVQHVDISRYAGKWYEIASFPQRFQKGCHCTTAEYTATEKGYITVENRCNKDSVRGKESYIKGKAFVEPNTGNAKLKVQFFWPFRGKYWIIDLADDYGYAVVGHPNRDYLWILCRTPKMEQATYNKIVERAKQQGFDISRLQKTPQL